MIARLFLFTLLLAGSAIGQAPEVVDTIFMSDAVGTRRVGRIIGVDANFFKIEVPLAVGGVMATVGVPRAKVSRVEFSPSEARDKLIANPTAENLAALTLEWQKWKPFLAVPRSPAGRVGNAMAAVLLSRNDPESAVKALEIFKKIETEAWSRDDEAVAKQGRLRALVTTGHASDAVAEAVELAKVSDDPSVLIEAKYILAEATQAKLRKLVDENPRWVEDPLVRPEYERLYNEALDLYLHPYLFLGTETEAASRGLWGAVQVYRFGKDDRNARESALDLTTLYKGTRHAKIAQGYLDNLPVGSKNP
jgi:hypothetical protein